MVCKQCKKKVECFDIYCLNCGSPSDGYKNQFKIKNILKETSELSKKDTTGFSLYYIAVMIPLLFLIYLVKFEILSDSYWYNYALLNVSAILVVPLLFLPLATKREESEQPISLRECFRYYPILLTFVFIMSLYFLLLKLVCQGDPILNIVRFIMVLWGLSVVFPVPFLIFKKESSLLSIIRQAYIAGKYLRWHQMNLIVVLGMLLVVSIPLLLIPFPAAMNYTSNAMYLWYKKQEDFKLYEKDKDY